MESAVRDSIARVEHDAALTSQFATKNLALGGVHTVDPTLATLFEGTRHVREMVALQVRFLRLRRRGTLGHVSCNLPLHLRRSRVGGLRLCSHATRALRLRRICVRRNSSCKRPRACRRWRR